MNRLRLDEWSTAIDGAICHCEPVDGRWWVKPRTWIGIPTLSRLGEQPSVDRGSLWPLADVRRDT